MKDDGVLQATACQVEKLLSPGHVVGEPIDLGDRVVVPVVEFGFGFGAGEGKGKEGGEGGGSGGGGGISPVALLVVEKGVRGADGIRIFTLRKEEPLAQLVSVISEKLAPQVSETIRTLVAAKEKEGKPEKPTENT